MTQQPASGQDEHSLRHFHPNATPFSEGNSFTLSFGFVLLVSVFFPSHTPPPPALSDTVQNKTRLRAISPPSPPAKKYCPTSTPLRLISPHPEKSPRFSLSNPPNSPASQLTSPALNAAHQERPLCPAAAVLYCVTQPHQLLCGSCQTGPALVNWMSIRLPK